MSKRIIFEVENFSVTYSQNSYKNRNVRDVFVNFISAPLSFLKKERDRYLVLDDISFKVYEGDVVGILGVNGVGKTSLCRYLAGIINSDEIKFNGNNICSVFDTNISIYPDLTGRENAQVLIELLFTKCTSAERAEILKEALEFSEIGDFADTPVNTYSKGMKARLYLSVVTSQKADLVILDEVFGGTDVFFTEKFKNRIKRFIKDSGAVVMVSHDVETIKEYCNRTIVLANKKVKFDGALAPGIAKYLSMETKIEVESKNLQ